MGEAARGPPPPCAPYLTWRLTPATAEGSRSLSAHRAWTDGATACGPPRPGRSRKGRRACSRRRNRRCLRAPSLRLSLLLVPARVVLFQTYTNIDEPRLSS